MDLPNIEGDTPCIAATIGWTYRSRRRRIPFLVPALLVLVFLAISSGGPLWAAGAVGAALFLPLLVFKLFFVAFILGAAMRVAAAAGWRGGRSRREPEPPTEEQLEWEEHLREARSGRSTTSFPTHDDERARHIVGAEH